MRDHDLRLGVPELVLEFLVADRGIHRHHDGAEAGDRQQGDDPLRPIRQIDGDTVTGSHAVLAERGRQRARLDLDLLERQLPRPVDEAQALRVLPRFLGEELRYMVPWQLRPSLCSPHNGGCRTGPRPARFHGAALLSHPTP